MSAFNLDADLEIGTVFEVAGSAIKIALKRDITELTRSHGGRVYDVGQIGSIVKMHSGRRILFATVRLLRLQSDEETAALDAQQVISTDYDRRVIEADLLGEAWFNPAEGELRFKRGVSTYPLPLQAVHLVTKEETDKLFESAEKASDGECDKLVTIGSYVGATRVPCRANIDKLFGHHCAILGSTGSGKSSAVAAVIHSILEHRTLNDRAIRPSIILIDPHGEYASAFDGRAKIYRAYEALGQNAEGVSTLKLPYWLMSSDEFRSLVIGKTEFEATSQANTVYKALAHSRMCEAGLVQSAQGAIPANLPPGQHPEISVSMNGIDQQDIASFDRDRPRPFKLEEFQAHITERQAKRPAGGGWGDVSPSDFQKDYSSILNKLRVLRNDPRIQFLMEEHDAGAPTLSTILGQFLNVDEDEDACLKIIDISGLPNEIAGPLTGAIARLLFQYKLHQSREERERDPVLFVCEEAHRYVPSRGDAQYEVAQTAVRRIAREGRKYGLGLMLVSQRPSDIEETVISQCNSWIVLRLANSNDQQHVAKILPDSLSGMTKLLSSLPRQEALFVGEAASIPARIRLRTLRREQLPDSNDISFTAGWSSQGTTVEVLDTVVARMTT